MSADTEEPPSILADGGYPSAVEPPLTPAYHKHDIQMVTVEATLAEEVIFVS